MTRVKNVASSCSGTRVALNGIAMGTSWVFTQPVVQPRAQSLVTIVGDHAEAINLRKVKATDFHEVIKMMQCPDYLTIIKPPISIKENIAKYCHFKILQ